MSKVVPPTAAAFGLTPAARRALLVRARDTIVRVVTGGRVDAAEADDAPPEGDDENLGRPAAAFVTLHVGGALRGCIGTSASRHPLWQVVGEMATAAATRDPRFAPITAGDLDGLSVEISVLSPERVVHDSSEIEIGRHGLEVRRRLARGLLLPQVAVDHDFDRERFLAETCLKAGLPADAWRDPATEVRLFEADVFSESDRSA
jgi:AmmeMemoRadiSam system protein A